MAGGFIFSIYIMLAPFIGTIFILFDYRRSRSTLKPNQIVLMYAILFTLLAMCSELAYEGVKGTVWKSAYMLSWAFNTTYFLFQVAAFGMLVLFVNYSIHQDLTRLKKLGLLVGAVCAVNVAALAINLFTGLLFTITSDHTYLRGGLYAVRLCISYSFMFLAIGDLAVSRRQVNRSLFILVLASAFPAAFGSTFDWLFPGARIVWPCFFASLLFSYLFIVRTNTMIDSLTGVCNRRGCDEFLLELSKPARKQDYTFVMIDMDRFKDINDRFGHAQGDQALCDVAKILQSTVRRTDFVARYGGDEFMVVAATREAGVIAEKLVRAVREFNAQKSRPYILSLSYGSGVYSPTDTRTPYEFLGFVDRIMYSKKTERRKADG